jgi:hypothetical protein
LPHDESGWRAKRGIFRTSPLYGAGSGVAMSGVAIDFGISEFSLDGRLETGMSRFGLVPLRGAARDVTGAGRDAVDADARLSREIAKLWLHGAAVQNSKVMCARQAFVIPDSIRASINPDENIFGRRWIAGSSLAMTESGLRGGRRLFGMALR